MDRRKQRGQRVNNIQRSLRQQIRVRIWRRRWWKRDRDQRQVIQRLNAEKNKRDGGVYRVAAGTA